MSALQLLETHHVQAEFLTTNSDYPHSTIDFVLLTFTKPLRSAAPLPHSFKGRNLWPFSSG
jgi:hypothetical protein